MKTEKTNYLLVGLFVLATLAMLLYVLFRITGRAGNVDSYYADFENIAGITPSTTVTYEGYPIGRVGEINPIQQDGRTAYLVEMLIRHDWRMPKDSAPRIIAFSLLAEFVVDISEGASTEMAAPGDILAGQAGIDINAAMNAIAGDVGTLTEQGLKPLMDKLNHYVETLGDEFEAKVPVALDGLNEAIAHLNKSAGALTSLLSDDNRAALERIMKNGDVTAGNMATLSGDLMKSRDLLDSALDKTNRMLDNNEPDVRQAVTHLREALAMIAENIDAIVLNLDGTSRNMYEFSRQLRQNPGLLLGSTPPKDRGTAQTQTGTPAHE
jgi:phospholipid/cholesterol/gamma-HCH transport system substrate-binding protein